MSSTRDESLGAKINLTNINLLSFVSTMSSLTNSTQTLTNASPVEELLLSFSQEIFSVRNTTKVHTYIISTYFSQARLWYCNLLMKKPITLIWCTTLRLVIESDNYVNAESLSFSWSASSWETVQLQELSKASSTDIVWKTTDTVISILASLPLHLQLLRAPQ